MTAASSDHISGKDATPLETAAENGNTPQAAAPARDGNVAIGQEYDAAKARDTVAAYQLFIDRHPQHPLANEARRRIDELRNQRGK